MSDERLLTMEDGFVLGDRALACRWRLAGGELPLMSRHMRALRERTVNGQRVSARLVAWAKQQAEWGLPGGAAEHPDGVFVLEIDTSGQAAISVEPYEPLAPATSQALVLRARAALSEAKRTGIAPETLWAVRDGVLCQGIEEGMRASGTSSLVADLAKTLGIKRVRELGLATAARSSRAGIDELFLASDEHGILVASDCGGSIARRFADGYATLLDKCRAHS